MKEIISYKRDDISEEIRRRGGKILPFVAEGLEKALSA